MERASRPPKRTPHLISIFNLNTSISLQVYCALSEKKTRHFNASIWSTFKGEKDLVLNRAYLYAFWIKEITFSIPAQVRNAGRDFSAKKRKNPYSLLVTDSWCPWVLLQIPAQMSIKSTHSEPDALWVGKHCTLLHLGTKEENTSVVKSAFFFFSNVSLLIGDFSC